MTTQAEVQFPPAVVRAMNNLNDEQREIFTRRYVCCESMERTCEEMGIRADRYQDVLNAVLRSMRCAALPRSPVAA